MYLNLEVGINFNFLYLNFIYSNVIYLFNTLLLEYIIAGGQN